MELKAAHTTPGIPWLMQQSVPTSLLFTLPEYKNTVGYESFYCKLFPVLQLAIFLVQLPSTRLQLLQQFILGLDRGQSRQRFWGVLCSREHPNRSQRNRFVCFAKVFTFYRGGVHLNPRVCVNCSVSALGG